MEPQNIEAQSKKIDLDSMISDVIEINRENETIEKGNLASRWLNELYSQMSNNNDLNAFRELKKMHEDVAFSTRNNGTDYQVLQMLVGLGYLGVFIVSGMKAWGSVFGMLLFVMAQCFLSVFALFAVYKIGEKDRREVEKKYFSKDEPNQKLKKILEKIEGENVYIMAYIVSLTDVSDESIKIDIFKEAFKVFGNQSYKKREILNDPFLLIKKATDFFEGDSIKSKIGLDKNNSMNRLIDKM